MNRDDKQSILFVDDERHILSSLQRLFRKTGYDLFFADSATQALSILAEGDIDVIVSDMQMPQMTGGELLKNVNDSNQRIKQIILSGYSDIQSTISVINNADVFAYIAKPWSDNVLLQTVEQALREKMLEDDSDILMHLLESKNKEFLSLNKNLEHIVEERTKKLRFAVKKIQGFNKTLEDSHKELVKLLVSIMGMKNGLSSKGAQSVADLSKKVALQMQLSEEVVDNVYYAAWLHEFGKLIIPDTLLSRSANTYSANDYDEYREHVSYAEMILSQIEFLKGAAQVIKSHEEHFDGSGFPDGLDSEDIPIGARILCTVKDYHMLLKKADTSNTDKEKETYALDIMNSIRSHIYDPQVLKILGELSIEGGNKIEDLEFTTTELIPGMVLSRGLYSSDDVLLLSKGRVLDEKTILKLSSFRHINKEKITVHIFNTG